MYRDSRARRRCAAPGCKTHIPRHWVMCETCWAFVPDGIRHLLASTYRPHQTRQPIRYVAAVRQAIDAVAAHRRTEVA